MTVSRALRIAHQCLRSLWRRRAMDDELSRELTFHYDALVEEYVDSGLSPEEARQAARRALGTVAVLEEQCRETRGLTWLDDLGHDLRFGLRLLSRHRAFAAVAVLSLALGIGVNTAVFSVVNAWLFRPLPVPAADRLVVIATRDPSGPALGGVSIPDLEGYREATAGVFEDIAAYSVGFAGLAADGRRAERVFVTWVTLNYFPLLGIEPLLGRLIREGERGAESGGAVVVLGHSTWVRRFGGDPSIVGRVVRVNGRTHTVTGVVPPAFHGTFAFAEAELYLPIDTGGATVSGADVLQTRADRGLQAIARLQAGVSGSQAQAAMDIVTAQLGRDYPDSNADVTALLVAERLARPYADQARSNAFAAGVILTLAGLVAVLAAVNVATLLLVRAAGRSQEFALRRALGAGWARLARQSVTEGLVLAGLGGIAGTLLGMWAARAVTAIPLPGDLPVRFDFALDGRVLAYVTLLVLGTGVLIGVLPAMRGRAGDARTALHGIRHVSSGAISRRTYRALVVMQISLCFVLLVATGLSARGLAAAERADLGFRPDGVLNVHMDVGQLGYSEVEGRRFFRDAASRVDALPGVEASSFALTSPMGWVWLEARVEGPNASRGSAGRVQAGTNAVSPRYFEVMGIDVIDGRAFTDADDDQAPRVAVVNERFAATVWPGQNPLGRRFRPTGADAAEIEVVGVTRTGRYRFPLEEPQPYYYVPIEQHYAGLRVLHVRTAGRPEALAPLVEQELRALAPDLPLYDVQSLRRAIGSGPWLYPLRVGTMAAATLGLVGLVLAIIGLYGVVADVTARRTHEIGLRMALGATRAAIARLVLGEGVRLVALGIGGGLAVTVAASTTVDGLLPGVSSLDGVTLFAAALVLACVALAASGLPTRRATRVDPAVALRAE